jgi:hypothetical protein
MRAPERRIAGATAPPTAVPPCAPRIVIRGKVSRLKDCYLSLLITTYHYLSLLITTYHYLKVYPHCFYDFKCVLICAFISSLLTIMFRILFLFIIFSSDANAVDCSVVLTPNICNQFLPIKAMLTDITQLLIWLSVGLLSISFIYLAYGYISSSLLGMWVENPNAHWDEISKEAAGYQKYDAFFKERREGDYRNDFGDESSNFFKETPEQR